MGDRNYMENLKKFYIGGQWNTPISDVTMPVLNPATEKQIATVAMGNANAVSYTHLTLPTNREV